MTLTPEATQALYADDSGLTLTEQLTAAYDRNVTDGRIAAPETVAAAGAAALAQAHAVAMEKPDVQLLPNLDPGFQAIAETAHRTSTQLFERIVVDTPDLHESAAAGITFARLSTA